MEKRMRRSYLTAVSVISIAATTTAAAQPNGFLIGPITYQRDVNGVPVNLTARTLFKIETTHDNKLYLKAQIILDLGDLQRKIGTIVDSFKLPHDNCRSYSGNNPVVSIPRKELRYTGGGEATFSISGSVDMWDCRENPIPNSKVEWKTKDVVGVKTKVPKVVTWPGNPIKNKLGSQSFDADLPIRLTRVNESSAALALGDPKVQLKGQYAFITNGILHISGIDLNQKAKDALQKAINPEQLRVAVPEEFQSFNPSIDEVGFIDDSGQLAANAKLSALIPPEKVTEMIKDLIDKKH